jgi:proline racemase
MSGHNTICVATCLVECGLLPEGRRARFVLEAPSGPVPIEADVDRDGRCRGVTFQGPPSFVAVRDAVVPLDPAACRALGLTKTEVRVDVAFGGMWYVVVDAPDLDLDLVPAEGARIRAAGELIKKACQRALPVECFPAWKCVGPAPPRHRAESPSEAHRDPCVPPRHPRFDYRGPDILAFRGPPAGDADARNAVVMSNGYAGMLDRSPCGSGTCAIMALLHARGDLAVGERFVHESVVGSRFVGELREVTAEGVVPAVTGSAWITRYAEVVVDPTDPFPAGFRVGDIW